uniref:activity-dependent neuroprotector homeobox protein 2-like n=1 Tax=Jaculus jaculus TaxID=51337 RepID=UPI001E1B2C5E|nr:activity-dependent neuroprotector homeobox protein 2-like [Jaculus jaculus]
MFQNPVENLDRIRKVRKRVKGILVNIGLDSCKELLKALKGFDPGEKYFYNTSWGDVAPWEPARNKVRCQTEQYCCSLCKYSTKMLTSLKNHRRRYHKDEADRALLIPCPNCQLASHPRVVDAHVSMFHSRAQKAQSSMANILGKEVRSSRRHLISFTCLKCSFSNTLYYNMKKHMLVAHFQNLVNSYFGLHTEETGAKPTANNTLCVKTPPDRYYCKKCNSDAMSHDALMHHVLTASVHKDLEDMLRSMVTQHIERTVLLKQGRVAQTPTSHLTMQPNNSAPGTTALSSCFHLALTHNHQNTIIMQPTAMAPDTSRNLIHSQPATAAQSHVTLVSSPLSLCQSNLTSQPSAPLPVFFSHGVALNEPVNTPMLTLSYPLDSVNNPETASILMNQTSHLPWVFTSHPSHRAHKEACGILHPACGPLLQPPGYAGCLTRDPSCGPVGSIVGICEPYESY